ncbi:hypothetical protein BC826DRAFT_976756 [Russula brevipes]|nr:hypothetical protein BC826DRAFT_976756 [Russula brevipes]
MPILGLPGTTAEEADEGVGAGVMANGTDPAYGIFNIPEGPRGLERALASTEVDSKAAGLRTVKSRHRTNWPAQENATKPRPPSQKPTHTRGVEGELPWEGINKKQRAAAWCEDHTRKEEEEECMAVPKHCVAQMREKGSNGQWGTDVQGS